MKPITLKLAGLQSYREPQTIDFTELCETGLFGIFGPTGSGKSTILDAITLALYGKVGRASGGTQGIMNHSEDSLFVAFTFELNSAAGTERYRVERRFKRQGELSVSNTISRFIEILPEGEKVVADKLADVTRYVEQKLGLKMDDFTRAVVLPQGKFAEFLSLKGADRRAMLQRLFHLEKYGDLLGQKLTRKVRANEQRRAEVAAEQQGLGNASAEALEQAAAAAREAAEHAAERRRELLLAQQRYDQLAKVRELAVERAGRAAQLEALRAQSGEIAALEAKLARGSAAEALRPVLTAWQEAQRAAAERARLAAEAEQAARAAAAAAAEAHAAAETAAAALGREEPTLLVRLEQLEQARGLQEEAARLGAELQRLAAQRAEGVQRKQQLAEQTAKEEQLLTKAQTRQRELEQQLKEAEVKAEERQLAQTAVQLAQQLTVLEEQLAGAEREEAAGRTNLQQATSKLEHIAAELAAALQSGQALAVQLAETAGQLAALEEDLRLYAGEMTAHETLLRQTLKARERHHWAARLAEQLQSGEPCPVCGSAHHPAPVQAEDGDADGGEAELETLAARIAEARELQFAVSRDRDACDALLQALGHDGEAAGSAAATFAAREAAAGAEMAAPDAPAPAPAGIAGMAALQQQALALGERHAACRRRLEALQQDGRAAQTALAALQPQRAAAEAAAAAASGLLEQAAARSAQHREALAAKRREWAELYPGITPEEAARQMESFAAKDRQAEDLRGRLALSVPFIEEKTAKLQALAGEMIELDKTLVQWEVQEQGKQELLREKQERLLAVAGERPVDALLAETREKLAVLRQQAESSRALQAETAARSHELAKAEALAGQAATAAREQEAELQARWFQALTDSPFEEETSVLDNLLAPGEADAIAGTVQNHRSREQELVIGLSELDAKLAGQTVGDEEWKVSEAALIAAKEQDEAALQRKARAERDWEDLQVRHVRWQELETVRAQLEQEAGLLAKLQSALRGNAFVEYVAEEQLMNVSHAASQRLRFLTKQRYALETDSGGGFVIRDDASGGVKRPVATLSGGETFLASLALALALSAQIQLRGQYPLQFFFLDEGFGTLDPELLDTVITSLEHLHHDHLSVGIISHVAELRSRLARKLVVIPAESGGAGSRIELERL